MNVLTSNKYSPSFSSQRLHVELYNMHPTNFFVPSFLKAINENTEQAFRNIMSEPSPGIFTFEMLQPRFCEMLLAEVSFSVSDIIQQLDLLLQKV